jgi:cysteine desulfurase/selenocysteine lyase
MDPVAAWESELLSYATERLAAVKDIRLFGTAPHKASLVSFLVGKIHPYDMGSIIDKMGIAIRTGHHCAQPLIDYFHIPGTVRASFALYNTKEEIDRLITAIEKAKEMLD